MRWLIRFFYFIIFFIALGFAIKNTELITIHWFFGWQSQAPLVLALFLTLTLGVVLGVIGMLGYWLAAKREISRLRKIAISQSDISISRPLPPYL